MMTWLLAAIPSPPSAELVLGPLRFRYYGLCIALGVLASVSIGRRRWAKVGGDPEDITTVAIVAVPAGLVGARLYHVITDFSTSYSGGRWWPNAFYIWNGGLGIPGGVLLGAIAAVIVCRRLGIDWLHLADAVAPAIPIAQAIGRLGNWFNQELYGSRSDLPWALRIDEPDGFAPDTTFHPTFLYEALWNVGLAVLIVVAGRRWVLRPGRWFAVYVIGYGVGRLWVEALRIDFANEILGVRINIWTALLAIGGGLVWLFWGGQPLDREATDELRSGGDPRARAGLSRVAVDAPGGEDQARRTAEVSSSATDEPRGPADEPSGPADRASDDVESESGDADSGSATLG